MANSHSPSKITLSNPTPLACEPLEERRMLATVEVFAAGSTGEETLEVRWFDEVVATFENVGGDAEAGEFVRLTFEVDFEGGERGDMDDLFYAFTNDLFIPGEVDRNLRIDYVNLFEFEGETGDLDRRETEAAGTYSTGTWRPEDGVVRGYRQSEFLHSNGFVQYTLAEEGGTRIRIDAAGSEGGEQFDLQIDGQTVETFTVEQEVPGRGSQSFEYVAPADQRIDYDQVRIVFTNDVFDPENGIDSNLIVDEVVVGRFSLREGGIFQQAGNATVFSTGTYRNEDGIVPGNGRGNILHANGFFQFGAFDTIDTVPDTSDGDIFSEDFSSNNGGFTFNPFGTDTADRGQFEIGVPQQTTSSGNPFQLASGQALVTGLSAGSGLGTFDVDGGVTSVLSPAFFLSADANPRLNVAYNFAHTGSATTDDQFRIGVFADGQVFNVLTESGSGRTRTGEVTDFSVNLEQFAGTTIQLLFEAEDDSNTIVEAAVFSIVVESVS